MYSTKQERWKDLTKVLLGELGVFGVAITCFISWIVIHLMISKWQNTKNDSDYLVSGSNNLIPEEM